ncbi:MAG: HigA family addiction module antidote protein [Alphaproteobacteria bacterium]|nr:HigA family addiction module antidote protein [Alphaproteobacteria bacterium]
MPMKNPPHPGGSVKEELEYLGLSIAEGAKALGVTRQQLYKVTTEQSAISPEMALRLEAVIGSTADSWLRMQVAHDLAVARRKSGKVLNKLKRLDEAVV